MIKTHSSTGSYHYWENDLKCQSIKVNEIIFYDLWKITQLYCPLIALCLLKKKLTLNVKLYNFLDFWDISLM